MVKHIYVLWKAADEAIDAFRGRLFEERVPELLALAPRALAVDVADVEGGPPPRALDDGSTVAGLVSVRTEKHEDAPAYVRALAGAGARVAGYAVSEAIPLDYDTRDWRDGETTPGVRQVTLLRRRPDLSRDEFLRRWHEVHTPLALEVHPLWAYNRNVVESALTPDAPAYDGIVELVFRDARDLLEPMRFFGGKPENIQRIVEDVKGWLDFEAVEYYAMRETIVRSG
ncbi:MAG: EthD domain-containing protein [Deltaproteobacteria bacterium]|nr:MAG: EthD domain-containing protein [Deltaproteobacteria bacterium]